MNAAEAFEQDLETKTAADTQGSVEIMDKRLTLSKQASPMSLARTRVVTQVAPWALSERVDNKNFHIIKPQTSSNDPRSLSFLRQPIDALHFIPSSPADVWAQQRNNSFLRELNVKSSFFAQDVYQATNGGCRTLSIIPDRKIALPAMYDHAACAILFNPNLLSNAAIPGMVSFEVCNAGGSGQLDRINNEAIAGYYEHAIPNSLTRVTGSSGANKYAQDVEHSEWKNGLRHFQSLQQGQARGMRIDPDSLKVAQYFGSPSQNPARWSTWTNYYHEMALTGHAQGYANYYDSTIRPQIPLHLRASVSVPPRENT